MKNDKTALCYNAGKIGGIPYITAYKNFEQADKEITNLGWEPVNPLYNGLQASTPWIAHMAVDLCLLASCQAVYFQRNWKNSHGARIEHRVAKFLRKTIIYQSEAGREKDLRKGIVQE